MEQVILFLVDDLHLEGRPEEMQKEFALTLKKELDSCKDDGDIPILVCAGDIAEKDNGIEWVAQFNCEIVYVCGNHEFWNNDYYEVIEAIKQKVKQPGYAHVHFLHNEEIVLYGIRFLGATMWTDLAKSWSWIKKNFILKNFYSMADFRKITARKFYQNSSKVDEMFKLLIENGLEPDQATNLIATESFNPLLQIEENAASVDFIENKIIEPFNGKTVVVTHHLPVPEFWMKKLGMNENILTAPYINNKSVYQEYLKGKVAPERDLLMMGFYVNTAYQFFEHNFAPDVWIHGHFHKDVDGYIGTTRVVSNPVGYIRQSNKLNIKKIVIGEEITNYLNYAIKEVEKYNWTEKVNSNLISLKKVISEFSKTIEDELLPSSSFAPILTVFKKQHDKNLRDVEVFVSTLLYNLIKTIHKDQEVSDQIYITSYVSGFGSWASKGGKVKFGIDPFIFNLNENSFVSESKYRKNKDMPALGHVSEWLKELDEIEGQVINFKKTLIDFFTHLQNFNHIQKEKELTEEDEN